MSEIRYCKKCRCDTRHDVKREIFPNDSLLERVFFAVGTLGFSALVTYKIATCQQCGCRKVIA